MRERSDSQSDSSIGELTLEEGELGDLPSEIDPRLGKRVASTALGGTLAVLGLKRRSLGGIAAALVGGWLAYRGVRGRTAVSRVREMTSEAGREGRDPLTVERSVTVAKPADELYRLWRDPDQLNRIVNPFVDVAAAGENRQRWTASGPLGRDVTWETEVVEDRPGERLRWEPADGSRIRNEGSLDFRPAPTDRGTEVTLDTRLDVSGGALGEAALSALGVMPDVLVRKALYRFQSLAETGEIPTLERNPSARGSGDLI